ncbi:MAG: hypothetical protein SFU99_17770 [Saprospiraceae bacterium]|nr:hypothetical protein [Saprospiraceae bacterium]
MMTKNVLKFSWMILIGISALMSACTEEDATNSQDLEAYANAMILGMQDSTGVGRGYCYELVFPVTIAFPDSTTAEVDSYEALATALKNWREANPESEGHPTLVLPFDVISMDDEIITIATLDELKALRRLCHFGRPHRPGHGRPGGGGHGNCACFEIVFPITIAFPDGTTAAAADQNALKTLIRAWRQANPGSTERPEIAFPITVTLEDGSTTTVESKEALQELKESCREDN